MPNKRIQKKLKRQAYSQDYKAKFKELERKFAGTREGFILPPFNDFAKWSAKDQKKLIKNFTTFTTPSKKASSKGRALRKLIKQQEQFGHPLDDNRTLLSNFKDHLDLRTEMRDYNRKLAHKRMRSKDTETFNAYLSLPNEKYEDKHDSPLAVDASSLDMIWRYDENSDYGEGYVTADEMSRIQELAGLEIISKFTQTDNGGYWTPDMQGVELTIKQNGQTEQYIQMMNDRMLSKPLNDMIGRPIQLSTAESQIGAFKQMNWTDEEIIKALKSDGLNELEATKKLMNYYKNS